MNHYVRTAIFAAGMSLEAMNPGAAAAQEAPTSTTVDMESACKSEDSTQSVVLDDGRVASVEIGSGKICQILPADQIPTTEQPPATEPIASPTTTIVAEAPDEDLKDASEIIAKVMGAVTALLFAGLVVNGIRSRNDPS